MNRREFLKSVAASAAVMALAQAGVKAESPQQDECHLVFDRISDSAYQAEWGYRRCGCECLSIVSSGGMGDGPCLLCSIPWPQAAQEWNTALRAREVIREAMNQACCTPDLPQITLTVPRWVAATL